MMQERKEERSLGELFAELARETSSLVRQEVELAKTELTHKATQVGKDAGVIGAGGAVAYAGLLVLLAAAVLGLGELMPLWLSALVVGLVVGAIGYSMIQKGRNDLKTADLTPHETIESLKEDTEWAKDQIK
jgi:xanthine/uracil permease